MPYETKVTSLNPPFSSPYVDMPKKNQVAIIMGFLIAVLSPIGGARQIVISAKNL
jgi:hypothetical protein